MSKQLRKRNLEMLIERDESGALRKAAEMSEDEKRAFYRSLPDIVFGRKWTKEEVDLNEALKILKDPTAELERVLEEESFEADEFIKKARALSPEERSALISKANAELIGGEKLSEQDRKTLDALTLVRAKEGEDWPEAIAVVVILASLAIWLPAVLGPGDPPPAQVIKEAGNKTSVIESLRSIVNAVGKKNAQKALELTFFYGFGYSQKEAKRASELVALVGKEKLSKKDEERLKGEVGNIILKDKTLPKRCPKGKILNPKTNACILDNAANRKKLGLHTIPEAPTKEEAAAPGRKPEAKKNAWIDFVNEYYRERKDEDPSYKYADAMRDAKEPYQKWKASQ